VHRQRSDAGRWRVLREQPADQRANRQAAGDADCSGQRRQPLASGRVRAQTGGAVTQRGGGRRRGQRDAQGLRQPPGEQPCCAAGQHERYVAGGEDRQPGEHEGTAARDVRQGAEDKQPGQDDQDHRHRV